MMRSAIALSLLALSATACVRVSPKASHNEVQKMVEVRSGARLSADKVADVDENQESLTVEQAVQLALLNNRSLQATLEELGISQADLAQATRVKNPVVEAEFRPWGNAGTPYELALHQDITDLLFLPNRAKSASAALDATRFRTADAVLDFALQVQEAFYSLQSAEQILQLRRSIAESSQAATELLARQRDAGNISDLDMENQLAIYEQSQLELTRSENNAAAAREKFNRLLGVANARRFQVVKRIAPIPESEPALDGLESSALKARLDLAAAQREEKAAQKSLKIARYSAFPNLSVGVHYEKEPDGDHTVGPSFEIGVPIFDWGAAQRSRAKHKLKQAQKTNQALQIDIPSEVREARIHLLSLRRMAQFYQDTVLPRRERILEQTQLHYNFMLQGTYQLVQAQQNLVSAKQEYIEMQRDYWIARAQLERIAGVRLPLVPNAAAPEREESAPAPDHSGHSNRSEDTAPTESSPPHSGHQHHH